MAYREGIKYTPVLFFTALVKKKRDKKCLDLSITIPAFKPVTLLPVILLLTLIFSLCENDATALVAHIVPMTLDAAESVIV